MDLEKEIEVLKKRIKLLEEFQELKKKVEELEKGLSKPIYIPCPYPVYPQPQPWTPLYQPWIPYQPLYTWTVTSGETSGQSSLTFIS